MSDDIPDNVEKQAGDAALGAASGAASGLAAGNPEQAAAGALDGALKSAPTPPGVPQGLPQGVPQGLPEGAPSGLPEGLPEAAPQALASAGQAVGQSMAAGAPPTAPSIAQTAAGAAAPVASQAAAQGLQSAGAPPEVASAGVDAATGQLGSMASAVTEIVAGQQALPKVNYTVAVENGPDAHWMVRRMQFSEALSELYVLDLELVTEDIAADTEQMLGANLELTIDRESLVRTISGLIHLVEYIGVRDDRLQIRVEVVPALHLLGQRIDTRLWQNATVVDVVTEVLEGGFADYERQLTNNLTATYEPREYIVQYHESDLDFVSRLLEAEGITYWFDHDTGGGKEVLVLEDSNDNVVDIATIDDSPELRIIVDRADNAEVESLQFLDWTRELGSTAVYQRVFDWLTPIEPIEATAPADGEPDADDRGLRREVYHHGRFVEPDPQPRTIRKLVHRTQRDKLARGFGNVTGFGPGRKFSLSEHQRPDMDREYLIRRIVHVGDAPEVMMGEGGSGPRYQNRFECLVFDSNKPFRPLPVTPRPRIYGPQTAIVTGPDGEEIHTDEHGRVKVRFDWDRVHALTDDTSMWIRVAHNWAGPGFGTFFVPRVGMEVLVEFLEGNPDQPLVVGCVYNGDNSISVGVPDNKTQSTIRTRSSPGSDGYNEMRFEDAAGSEEIFVHAQKDYNEVVENNHSTTVHGNQTNSVDGNQSQSIGGDQSESITGEQTMTVDKNRTVTIKGSQAVTILGGAANSGVSGSKLGITGDYKVDASNTIELQAPTHIKLTCGSSSITLTPGKIEITAGGKATIVLDANALMQANGGAKVFLDANALASSNDGSQLFLDANALTAASGGASILLDANVSALSNAGSQVLLDGNALVSGVGTSTVTAPTSTLSGDGGGVEAAAAGVKVSGAKVDVTGDGAVTVSGGTVKIN
jgi:type VI secretion system secreted protein VgrG